MRVTRDDVCESTVEQRVRASRARRPSRPSTDAAVSWTRSPPATIGSSSSGRSCTSGFRSGWARTVPNPWTCRAEEPIGQIERPADVRRLDEQVARPAEPEPRQLLLRPVELVEIELGAADELDRRIGGPQLFEGALHRSGVVG